MRRGATAQIDLAALRHNFARAQALAGGSRIMAAVKANAYGHGMLEVANALTQADGFAVACVGEALQLRAAGHSQRILVLQGARSLAEHEAAARHRVTLVVHHAAQVEYVRQCVSLESECWVKLDTGMGRLGFAAEDFDDVLRRLGGAVSGMMSHFANADVPEDPRNQAQLTRFLDTTAGLNLPRSMANSAALFRIPQARFDWVRPGIMLYGGSPLARETAEAVGLRPVMTLTAPLLAINRHVAGDSIGYGGHFTCPERMPVGLVAIGYADGYHRVTAAGTRVMINGVACGLIGR
ncbi:MAG: alanine racemase, partial [Thiotrichales bacterium]